MMVTILMATYNGAKFIPEQIESILAQTYEDWELIIRDDCSTDSTVSIIKSYSIQDSRIKLLDLPGEHGSSVINFSVLFDYARSSNALYVMFSDQDDIWQPNKVADSLAFVQRQEDNSDVDLPILMYGSVQYVDADGSEIHKELAMPQTLDLQMLLCENHAYGCTLMMNGPLLMKVRHIPHVVENHDYWIALVSCAFGKAVHNPSKLILYRQHKNNVSGNVERSKISARLFRYVKQVEHLLPVFTKNLNMVGLFYDNYVMELGADDKRLIKGYLAAFRKNGMSLLNFMLVNKLRKLGVLQSLAHYYIILRLRKKVVVLLEPNVEHHR